MLKINKKRIFIYLFIFFIDPKAVLSNEAVLRNRKLSILSCFITFSKPLLLTNKVPGYLKILSINQFKSSKL